MRPYLKHKRVEAVSHLVKHLAYHLQGLEFNPSTIKQKKQKNVIRQGMSSPLPTTHPGP
jgi:hypothetical protein